MLGSGGAAPRSVIAHEVMHALQDEHFRISRAAPSLRARATTTRELAAQALVEGDATDVQARYVAGLSAGDLIGELARTLGSIPSDSGGGEVPYLQRELRLPVQRGPGVREGAA